MLTDGVNLNFHAFRQDELKEFNLTLVPPELTTCYLGLEGDISNDKDESHKEWLFFLNLYIKANLIN